MNATYDIDHWMVAWTPGDQGDTKQVRVGPWPDYSRWSDAYDMTSGCCNLRRWPTLTHHEKIQEILNGFFYLVLSERLDPDALLIEFLKIREFKDAEASFLGGYPYILFQDGKCSPYNP